MFAYVFDRLAVLTVVHLPEEQAYIISFRIASKEERYVYHEWLENDSTAYSHFGSGEGTSSER